MNKEEIKKENFIKDCKWLFKKPIYHRGKFDNRTIYENTIEAYKASIEDQSPFEFDVQLTNDLQVVCFHDNNLKRIFNKDRLVSDISYKRINKIREDFQVPLLKDVLKMCDGKVELMIELKHTTRRKNKILVKQVYDLIKDYKGKYVIVSFNPFILKDYKKLDNNAYIGLISSNNIKGFVNKIIVNNSLIVKPDFISYDVINFNEKRLEKYKQKGYKITGWSLKNIDNIKELKKYFDNFIIEGIESKEI